jgi:hypothetical protein
MPRPLRPIADGLIYHVINRGNNRQKVFHKPGDYHAFLKALADIKEHKPFGKKGVRTIFLTWHAHFRNLLACPAPCARSPTALSIT